MGFGRRALSEQQKPRRSGAFRHSGGGIRTRDLRVMSPTAPMTKPPYPSAFLPPCPPPAWSPAWSAPSLRPRTRLPHGRARSHRAGGRARLDELSEPQGLTQNESTFTRREVIRTLAERFGSEGAYAVGELADRFLESQRVVLLVPDREPPEARYSTPDLLATERELLDGAIARRGEGAGRVDARTIAAVLAAGPSCRTSRRRWCAASPRAATVCSGGGRRRLGQDLRARAGARGWEASGYRVIGAALAARGAAELEAGSGMPTRTLARPNERAERSVVLLEQVFV